MQENTCIYFMEHSQKSHDLDVNIIGIERFIKVSEVKPTRLHTQPLHRVASQAAQWAVQRRDSRRLCLLSAPPPPSSPPPRCRRLLLFYYWHARPHVSISRCGRANNNSPAPVMLLAGAGDSLFCWLAGDITRRNACDTCFYYLYWYYSCYRLCCYCSSMCVLKLLLSWLLALLLFWLSFFN